MSNVYLGVKGDLAQALVRLVADLLKQKAYSVQLST